MKIEIDISGQLINNQFVIDWNCRGHVAQGIEHLPYSGKDVGSKLIGCFIYLNFLVKSK